MATTDQFEQFRSVDQLNEGDTVKVRFTTEWGNTHEVEAVVERPTKCVELSGEVAGEETEMTLLTEHHQLWATGGAKDSLLGRPAHIVAVKN